jgi:propionyl-CoA carboxylase alpha chain/3-methylcrotonyl-CoA carboxylase alpha subunit/acetyl-CoA/propionyl-CoA carboxylase biotin carboxyl carrier protein
VAATRIRKVLIANRGEISVRIGRTLRALGLDSVAVHHAEEAGSLAVREADEAVELFGATPVAAHLDAEQLIDAALRTGADAIHPGYGFLSENAAFADRVAAAGLTFIGPPAAVIRLMGDKVASRDFVRAHGFPVAPSAYMEDGAADFAARAAAIGFPLLVKAAAGGGGKGMHIVREAAELQDRLRLAQSEAARYFGDGRVYCERYIERPRHIEVQVLADSHGACVHLWERECSVQRRFQKIVEETPSPGLTPALAESICAAAVGIARACGYVNAGTVEFILSPDGDFYFLEMNTRLQVEHPVTEMVTGLDLVAEQIRIAEGDALGYGQSAVRRLGHAIECRIYAEDTEAGFVPAIGTLALLRVPSGPGLRFDSGMIEGQRITTAFDPMLAKLVAHGVDREDAIRRLRGALQRTVMLGVTTNADYLHRLLGHPDFVAGRTDTGFVDRHADALAAPPTDAAEIAAILAVAADADHAMRQAVARIPEPYASIGAWRN